MKHHTKDKGDKAVGHVIADLLDNDFQVCLPISEHLPFDLIAVNDNAETLRIQVKYRKLKNGVLQLEFKNVYSNSRGVKSKRPNLQHIDAYAVYCPDNGEVYYVRVDEIPQNRNSFWLRVEEPKTKGHQKKVRWASEFEGAARIF